MFWIRGNLNLGLLNPAWISVIMTIFSGSFGFCVSDVIMLRRGAVRFDWTVGFLMTTVNVGEGVDASSNEGIGGWLSSVLLDITLIGAARKLPGSGVRWVRREPLDESVSRQPASWFEPTLVAMGRLRWGVTCLPDGARGTQPGAAADLLRLLVMVLDDKSPVPSIVPTWRGGVQAEWHENGVILEIEADPSGSVEYYFSCRDEEYEGTVEDDLSDLIRRAGFLLSGS